MSAREPADRDGSDESFLSRWSRRKARSRADTGAIEPAPNLPGDVTLPPTPAPDQPPAAAADPLTAASQVPQPPAIELPDLDLLGEDSDYSAFLTPGVDADLRKRALRKLFSAPKFNVFDGLDTYRDDYTSFPALGSIVTADMRYHVERLAKKAVELLDEQTAPVAPGAPAAVAVATDAVAEPEAPAPATSEAPPDPAASTPDEPPAPAPEENHDRIA